MSLLFGGMNQQQKGHLEEVNVAASQEKGLGEGWGTGLVIVRLLTLCACMTLKITTSGSDMVERK